MAEYLTVRLGGYRHTVPKNGEQLKKIAVMLTRRFCLTYDCFLYPYVDAHAVYGKNSTAQPFDNIIVVRADRVDKAVFASEIKAMNLSCGVCWYFASRKEAGTAFKDDNLISSDNAFTAKPDSCFVFSAGTASELFNLSDYIIREYSRRLCMFMEIAVREIERCGGKVLFCGGDRLFFKTEKGNYGYIKKRITEILYEKLGEYFSYSNIFFDKLIIN